MALARVLGRIKIHYTKLPFVLKIMVKPREPLAAITKQFVVSDSYNHVSSVDFECLDELS